MDETPRHSCRRAEAAHGVPFDDEPRLIARIPDHELWMTSFSYPDHDLRGLASQVSRARREPP